MFCPECGKQVPDGSRFCGSCGTKIMFDPKPAGTPAPEVPGSGGNMPPVKKFPVKRLLIILAAVIAVLAIVLFLFVFNGKDSDPEQAASADAAETTEEAAEESTEESAAVEEDDAGAGEAEAAEDSYCYVTACVYDEDGNSISYGEATYTNGILTGNSWDYAAYNAFIDAAIELEVYDVDATYTENGDLVSGYDHRVSDEEEYEYIVECSYEYDSEGRPVTGTYYDNYWIYEQTDLTVSYDENGEVSRFALEYDDDGWLEGIAVVFTRDGDSCTVNLEEYEEYDGETDSYTYDVGEWCFEDGRISSITIADGTNFQYAYNLMNVLNDTRQYIPAFTVNAMSTLNDGIPIEFAYDEYGNCIKTSFSDGTAGRTYSYTYDENGNITQCVYSDQGTDYYCVMEYRYE